MLLHLPIVTLATLSPIAVADTVPKFDIVKECHFESESSKVFARCSHEEAEAFHKVQAEWQHFVPAEKSTCFKEATIGGIASYVEFLICLEMARDVDADRTNSHNPPANTASSSLRPVQPE